MKREGLAATVQDGRLRKMARGLNSPAAARNGLLLLSASVFLTGCHTDMWRQTTTDPMDESGFYADGSINRPLVAGTIARGHLRKDDAFFTGARDGKWVTEIPMQLDQEGLRKLLARGQDRYTIYCTPCHGQLGDGQGMIAHRGFATRRPVGNYHTDRLRNMPIGHFYDVITNGYGAMYSYASRVEPQDRWAIAAYIRALQFSQNAPLSDADPDKLAASKPPATFLNPSAPNVATTGGQP